MDVVERLKLVVKDVPDFPREGILFKDIMPIFRDPSLVNDTCLELIQEVCYCCILYTITERDPFKIS